MDSNRILSLKLPVSIEQDQLVDDLILSMGFDRLCIIDFIMVLDARVADYDFTCELITRLKDSLSLEDEHQDE